jgi:hypothetical protein
MRLTIPLVSCLTVCRDLTSPFVSDLESLLEQINPHYCRSSRQHSPAAVLAALSDGGSLALHSYTSWGHSMSMAKAGVLQDLLGGFAVVRPYLAASSTHRKAFHQVGGRGRGGEKCVRGWVGGFAVVIASWVACSNHWARTERGGGHGCVGCVVLCVPRGGDSNRAMRLR